MKKIYSTILMLAMMFAALSFTACSGDDNDSPNGSINEPDQKKVDIVAVWKEATDSKESVISLAKDGTYKMMLKQENSLFFFISTGRYTIENGFIVCKDNCVDAASKSYSYTTTADGKLVVNGKSFIKSGVEDNALENKISGTSHTFGGYTIGGIGHTDGECNYILQFTNDYRAYKSIETTYYKDSSKNNTKKTSMHYIFYDDNLYIAEENSSISPKYHFEYKNSIYTEIYYTDETGKKNLP